MGDQVLVDRFDRCPRGSVNNGRGLGGGGGDEKFLHGVRNTHLPVDVNVEVGAIEGELRYERVAQLQRFQNIRPDSWSRRGRQADQRHLGKHGVGSDGVADLAKLAVPSVVAIMTGNSVSGEWWVESPWIWINDSALRYDTG